MTTPVVPVPGGAHRLDGDAVTAELATTHGGDDRPSAGTDARHHVSDSSGGGVPVVRVVLFLLGCVLLVVAAANITHLGGWSDRWGAVPVFLVFFLVMSIAGRCFWTGADAILNALMWGKNR